MAEENQRLREELREYAEDLHQVMKERATLLTALMKAEDETYRLQIKSWLAEHEIYHLKEALRTTDGERQMLQVAFWKAEDEMQRAQEALRKEKWMRTVEAEVARIQSDDDDARSCSSAAPAAASSATTASSLQ